MKNVNKIYQLKETDPLNTEYLIFEIGCFVRNSNSFVSMAKINECSIVSVSDTRTWSENNCLQWQTNQYPRAMFVPSGMFSISLSSVIARRTNEQLNIQQTNDSRIIRSSYMNELSILFRCSISTCVLYTPIKFLRESDFKSIGLHKKILRFLFHL